MRINIWSCTYWTDIEVFWFHHELLFYYVHPHSLDEIWKINTNLKFLYFLSKTLQSYLILTWPFDEISNIFSSKNNLNTLVDFFLPACYSLFLFTTELSLSYIKEIKWWVEFYWWLVALQSENMSSYSKLKIYSVFYVNVLFHLLIIHHFSFNCIIKYIMCAHEHVCTCLCVYSVFSFWSCLKPIYRLSAFLKSNDLFTEFMLLIAFIQTHDMHYMGII